MSRESQEQELRARFAPREVEVELRLPTWLRQLQSRDHRLMRDEKEAQQGRLTIAGREVFSFFEML